MEAAIRTEHLTKIYGQRLIAVNDMNLEVPKGSVFGLLGPNGAGKTTALRLLLGLQRPTAGRAEVFGKGCGPNAVSVRSQIGYLPTNPKLPGNLRPIEYLDLLGKLSRLPSQIRKPRISALLRSVGLLGATDQRIETFSTGMCTRLGIAASLVADPALLLWDEPTAGLDPSARRFTLDLIGELGKTKTVVVATHILGDIDQICDHLGVMHEGRMIFTGSMQDMKRRLRQDDFTLELEGEDEDIRHLAQEAAKIEGLEARVGAGETLVVGIADGHSRCGVLAEVLKLVDARKVRLQAIHSGQNATENAYLQLLQEDESHGFGR
ncbi:MAG: ABC transporter ATP-binding protein [Planctomycetes bacterium]|nr:ABC transporter ATP-binding protein [Planctomycetota bacterium]MBL7152252.1 ABC transporter ATP-binding protein [Phycisphaerae bacterium]